MMRSLSTAVTGLRSHQTRMDVIGNNIANVNTFGFKSSRATFQDVFYQTLGRGATPGGANINPTQVGFGAAMATINILNQPSGSTATDRAMDVAIAGDGFIAVQDERGDEFFTRLGVLGFDAAGNLVNANGFRVLCFARSPISVASADFLATLRNISISPRGVITGISLHDRSFSGNTGLPDWMGEVAELTQDRELIGNIRLDVLRRPTVTDNSLPDWINSVAPASGINGLEGGFTFTFNSRTGRITAVGGDPEMTLTGIYSRNSEVRMTDSSGRTVLTLRTDMNELPVDTDGESVDIGNVTFGPEEWHATLTASELSGRIMTESVVVEGGMLSFPELGFAVPITLPEGDLADANLRFSGNLGRVHNDDTVYELGTIGLARFPNPGGLNQIGNSLFAESPNSGEATFFIPDTNGVGALRAGHLEMSNVEIAQEFTDMIVTQRGFQANSRIVTVSDEMLQEIANMKR